MTDLAQQSYNLGNACTRLGEYTQAEEAYLMAINEYPDYYEAAYNLARLYSDNKQYTKAYALVDKFIDRYPEKKELDLLRAYLLYYLGNQQESLAAYERIIDHQGDNELRITCAKIALEMKEYEKARTHLTYLYDEHELSGELLFLLGETERLSGVSDGMQWYESAVLQEPGYQPALQHLIDYAKSHEDDDLTREIGRIVKKAVEASPDDPLLVYEYAKYLLSTGDEQGVSYMKRALTLGYHDTDALLAIYDDLQGKLADSYLAMLGESNIIRVVQVECENHSE